MVRLKNLIAVKLRINVSKKKTFTKAFNVEKVDHELWHKRLGHISKAKFIELKNVTSWLLEELDVQSVNHV